MGSERKILVLDSIVSVAMASHYGTLVEHTYDASFCPMRSVEVLDFDDAFMFDVGCSDQYRCSMHTVLIVIVVYNITEYIIEWKIKRDWTNKMRHSILKLDSQVWIFYSFMS